MEPIERNAKCASQVEYHKPIRASSKRRRFAVRALGALCALCWGGVGGAEAANLPVVTPVTTCADLLQIDFTGLEDAPTKLDSAVVVEASAANPTQQCVVTGYVASKVEIHCLDANAKLDTAAFDGGLRRVLRGTDRTHARPLWRWR